jgi:hypothetical protein
MQTKVNSVAIRATNATGAGKTSTLKIGDEFQTVHRLWTVNRFYLNIWKNNLSHVQTFESEVIS